MFYFIVMNLVLCDESDELIAGALDMLYTTLPHLNIKHLGVNSNLKKFQRYVSRASIIPKKNSILEME